MLAWLGPPEWLQDAATTSGLKATLHGTYSVDGRSLIVFIEARTFFGIFFGFFWYFFGFCAVSGYLEAPLHHLWPFGSLQTTPGLPDDHFWPNHGSKTIVRAFGF